MKTNHNLRNEGGSCSCTSCVYKSESEHPSLNRFIAQGSKIDRLYYGKYIPLRERKLLSRLVRTRAVYDDIRAQLISDSTFSLSTKGDSKPTKSGSVKELDDTEKSSGAILELVNIVDKGALLAAKLSNCCSCCSCSSKIQIQDTSIDTRRRKRLYAGAQQLTHARRRYVETANRRKGVRFKGKRIRSDPCTCTLKFSGLLKKHSKAIFKRMHTTPVEPLLDMEATTFVETKPRREGIRNIARTSYQNIKQANIHMKEKMLEGVSKIKESQTKIQEKIKLETKRSLKKLTAAKDSLTSKVKSSVQKLKTKSKTKLQCICPEGDIASQVKKDSIIKFKEDLEKKQLLKDWVCDPTCIQDTCTPEDCFIKLKQKKSLKAKHKNKHRKGIKRYEIETYERKIGEPLNQSHVKIQTWKQAKMLTSATKKQKPMLRTKQTQEVVEKRINVNIGSNNKDFNKIDINAIETSNEKSKTDVNQILSIDKSKKINDNNPPPAQKRQRGPPKKLRKENISLNKKSNQYQAVKIGSSFSFNIEFYKNKSDPKMSAANLRTNSMSKQQSGIDYNYNKHTKAKKVKRPHLRHQSSQIILKKSLKEKKTGGHALRRCFCTLKLKAKATKSKFGQSRSVKTTDRSVMTFHSLTFPCNLHCTPGNRCSIVECRPNNKSRLLSYECEPGVCTPGDCDPYQCIKLINARKKQSKNCSVECALLQKQNLKNQSTSSFTLRSNKLPKAKYVQSMITSQNLSKNYVDKRPYTRRNLISNSNGRNAVRIGSTFSFNIEFYKGNPYSTHPANLKVLTVKPKPKVKLKQSTNQSNVKNRRKNIPTQIYKKESNALIGTALKRCFCTLKLQKKEFSKNRKKKYIAAGTETVEPMYLKIDTASKGTKTQPKYSRLLEPFECEPFTCVPGECDPYKCLERINRRNIRLKEIGLNTKYPEMTSSSNGSTHSRKHMKAVQIQSKPKYKERKVLVRTKEAKKRSENKSDSRYSSSVKAKQAVKIGSTFSFNVEFYKNKTPNKKIKPISPIEKTIKISTKGTAKDKGVKINRLNVAHIDTQVQKTKKHHKGSMVGPLLKRCFCTLNLQKKWKKEALIHKPLVLPQRMYEVNRAIIAGLECNKLVYSAYKMDIVKQRPYFDFYKNNNIHKSLIYKNDANEIFREKDLQQLKNCSCILPGIKTWAPIKKESQVNSGCDNQQTSKKYNQKKAYVPIDQNDTLEKTLEDVIKSSNLYTYSSSLQVKENHNIGLTRYFRRCFCTMNLKIENRAIPNRLFINESRKNNKIKGYRVQKLKPYECEPGICIPGVCDPYECQKMISKRLQKGIGKKSGTMYTSKSISSSAGLVKPQFKSKKQQKTSGQKLNYTHIYKKPPTVDHRQAVRVASNFSFNIEFSKNATLQRDEIFPKYSSDTNIVKPISKTKGTRKKTNHNTQSTSLIETAHKDSSTMPTMKRCFCTLKLQKKGKLHKEFKNKKQIIPFKNPKIAEVKTINRGQNTVRFKPQKIAQSLKPYECEPNICEPGNCDPYQCLEIMKRNHYNKYKKEFGSDTFLHGTKSVSSETPNSKIRYKTRAVNISKERNSKSLIPKGHSEISMKKPLRQIVRVGSSFSFDIEFFKDQPTKQSEYKEKKHTNKSKHVSKINKNINSNYSRDRKILRNKQSQNLSFLQTASTMTESFIKRCFCTARFYKAGRTKNIFFKKDRQIRTEIKKVNDQNIQQGFPYYCEPGICVPNKCNPYLCEEKLKKWKSSFIKRCFCVLSLRKKKRNRREKVKKDNKKLKEVKTKSIMTKEESTLFTNALLPYECEPNVCVPYQCNPYECEKRIKLRNKSKFYKESGISTTFQKKKNFASLTDPYKKSKTKNQSTIHKDRYKNIKTRNIKLTDKPKLAQSRQSVKLGSTFSFNIEFTKRENFDDLELEKHAKNKVITSKYLPHNLDKADIRYNKRRNVQKRKKMNTNQSQADIQTTKTQSTMTALSPSKRCFCTLNLRKPKVKRPEHVKTLQTDVSTETNKYILPIKPTLKLLPYECEPGICVPGECDPKKCFDLIKKRKNQYRNSGTIPRHSQKRNAFVAMTKRNNETKNKKLQYKSLKSSTTKLKLKQPMEKDGAASKQAVRIGSNFSFNIEFYKNKMFNYEDDNKHLLQQQLKIVNRDSNINKDRQYAKEKVKLQKLGKRYRKGKISYGEGPVRKQNIDYKTDTKKDGMRKNKKFQSRALQSTRIKKESKGSSMNPFLKRCFCTLKLQKIPARKIFKPFLHNKHNFSLNQYPKVITKNKSTATLRKNVKIQKLSPYECEPFYCVPGECDPYVCAERIIARERDETRSIKTQVAKKQAQKNVHAKLDNYKTQRLQANFKDPAYTGISQQSEIVEVPRFSNMVNKQAVRVGSNISFSVEFYKETLPQTSVMKSNDGRKMKKNSSKMAFKPDQRIKKTNIRSCGSQGDYTKTEEKCSETNNVLKRCFCTLQLQNKFKTKNAMNIPKVQSKFPQVIEVRRVAVHRKPKMSAKQTHTKVKSISTKINTKYFNENENLKSKYNSCLCRKGKTMLSNDMKTILPYRSTKFNTAISKTLIRLENDKLRREALIINRGKRLTRKKSDQHIVPENLSNKKNISNASLVGFKKFFREFARICLPKKTKSKNIDVIYKEEDKEGEQGYSPRNKLNSQNRTRLDSLKLSKSERQTRTVSKMPVSKSDSVKLGCKYDSKKCKDNCQYHSNNQNKYLLYQGGDTVYDYPVMLFKINEKHQNDRQKEIRKEKQTKKPLSIDCKPLKQQHIGINKEEHNLCAHCLMKNTEAYTSKHPLSSLRVHFLDARTFKDNSQAEKANVNKFKKTIHKETDKKIQKLANLCKYCASCGKEINREEFKKAAGDQLNIAKKTFPQADKPKMKKVDNICSGEAARKPLFEMQINSDSYQIINKDEVIQNVVNLKAKNKTNLSKLHHQSKIHQKSCRCCVCLAKKNKTGATIKVAPKGSKVCDALSKWFYGKKNTVNIPSRGPCICGSLICSQKIQKVSNNLNKRKEMKRCVCNSPICERESPKMREIYKRPDKITCVCKKKFEKKKKQLKKQQEKKENKKRAIRLKEYKKQDRIRNKKRRKEQKDMEKRINKKSSDIVLIAESAIDIGKFGITACVDILRMVARTAADPKHAYKTLRNIRDNPKLLSLHLKSVYKDSGVASTARRVRLRCLAMKGVKTVRSILESYAITKYILYIASKDPKRRLVKKQRVRERFDYGCSLYMGSLRTRPFLSVYDRCPWFYPHFLSLLNVWKQFMDVMLFLLAVVAWSPCILCMEACRAMMCCLFCTG